MTMQELIERLEKATGADRSLDWELHYIRCGGLSSTGMYGDHPRYTSSIDAALTLVPEGWRARIETADPTFNSEACRKALAFLTPFDGNDAGWKAQCKMLGEVSAATPTIALVIASLRARLALTSDGEKE